jgi:hypothetical protein
VDKLIVHRDLKPANIFVSRTVRHDGRLALVLGDVGLAKAVATTAAQVSTVGTPLYLAPETRGSKQACSLASDVCVCGSLGIAMRGACIHGAHAAVSVVVAGIVVVVDEGGGGGGGERVVDSAADCRSFVRLLGPPLFVAGAHFYRYAASLVAVELVTGSAVHVADTGARDANRAERLAFEATARMSDLLAFADDAPLTPEAARLLLTACTFVQAAQRATMRDVRAACRGVAAPDAGPEEVVEARRRQVDVVSKAQVAHEAETAGEAAKARKAEEARSANALTVQEPKARAEAEPKARDVDYVAKQVRPRWTDRRMG